MKTTFLAAFTAASLVPTNAVSVNEPRMTITKFLQQVQGHQGSTDVPSVPFPENAAKMKNLEGLMSRVFEKGMLVNSTETARRLLERPVQPEYLEPCFFERDGCTTCWVDTYYQLAEWECPNFCGEGRDFTGHVTSNLDVVSGKYERDAAECELLLCSPIKKGHCNGFVGNPFFNENPVPFEQLWTCQEQCYPETLTKAPAEVQLEWSLSFTALVALIGVVVVVALFFLLECLFCRGGNKTETEIEGLVKVAPGETDVSQIDMKWKGGDAVYRTDSDENIDSDEGDEGVFMT